MHHKIVIIFSSQMDKNGCNSDFCVNDRTTEGNTFKTIFDAVIFEELINQPSRIMGDARFCTDHIFPRYAQVALT